MADTHSPRTLVALTASSKPLYPWPFAVQPDRGSQRSESIPAPAGTAVAAQDPDTTADEIDESFIDFRRRARTDFHEFANQFGYLGKQLYVAVNFGESLIASAVFNGTDVLRGEGLLKNLGEFASDIFTAAVWVVADELYLHLPGLPPIVTLPRRAPEDAPLDWRRPLPPQPGRPLQVPFDPVDADSQRQAPAVDSAHSPTVPTNTDTDTDTDTEADAEADADLEAEPATRKVKHKPTEDVSDAEETEADEPTETASQDSGSDTAGSSNNADE
jgi:hypothetical protein